MHALPLDVPREVLLRHLLALLALVGIVKERLLEVRRPRGRRVEPLPDGVGKLVVVYGDGVLDAAPLKGVACPAVVVNEVIL